VKTRVVLLLSGGLDSAVAYRVLEDRGFEVYPLFIDYEQKTKDQEYAAAYRLVGNTLKVFKISGLCASTSCDLFSGKNSLRAELHARNYIFLTMAIPYAKHVGATYVSLGIITDLLSDQEEFKDVGADFIDIASQLLNSYDLALSVPLYELNKITVLRLAKNFGLDWKKTYSCLLAEDPCGVCSNCKERAFAESLLDREVQSVRK